MYASNATMALRQLQPDDGNRRDAWAPWERHEAMDDDFKQELQDYAPRHDENVLLGSAAAVQHGQPRG